MKQNIRQGLQFMLLQAEEERFSNILRRDDEKGEIFKITKQMARTHRDVVGENCIRNDHDGLVSNDCAKEKAWENYYSRLLNEFEWDKDGFSSADPILVLQLGERENG